MNGWREKEASNQALFRDVNEHIEQLAGGFGVDGAGEISFVCECRNADCTQAIDLTRIEYEHIREYSNRFAVALNHENPEAELIVAENERFAVVESYAGEASQIARETDPRSQAHTRTLREEAAKHAAALSGISTAEGV